MRKHLCLILDARRLFVTALMTILLATAVGCVQQPSSGDAMPERDINAVMTDHVDELMAIEGVTGVAIGALDDGTPCILVLVVEETDALAAQIPKTIEGHPTQLYVSGEIKPMTGDSDS